MHNKWTGRYPCIGAMDCKHVEIERPPHSGSTFFNYKKTFSIHMLGVVDASYRFVYIKVGANGRQADASVLRSSQFYRDMKQGNLNLPPNKILAGLELQYSFLTDRGYPLKEHIIVPYTNRQMLFDLDMAVRFNRIMSGSRRMVECVWGHLHHRFRVFDTSINLDIESIDAVFLAYCYLHNFLSEHDASYRQGIDDPGLSTTIAKNRTSLPKKISKTSLKA